MKPYMKPKSMKMKNIFKTVLFLLGWMPIFLNAQAVEKNTLVLGIKYFNDNNASQHIVIQAKSKIDGKFQKIAKAANIQPE